jgi:hypothetical protein
MTTILREIRLNEIKYKRRKFWKKMAGFLEPGI